MLAWWWDGVMGPVVLIGPAGTRCMMPAGARCMMPAGARCMMPAGATSLMADGLGYNSELVNIRLSLRRVMVELMG